MFCEALHSRKRLRELWKFAAWISIAKVTSPPHWHLFTWWAGCFVGGNVLVSSTQRLVSASWFDMEFLQLMHCLPHYLLDLSTLVQHHIISCYAAFNYSQKYCKLHEHYRCLNDLQNVNTNRKFSYMRQICRHSRFHKTDFIFFINVSDLWIYFQLWLWLFPILSSNSNQCELKNMALIRDFKSPKNMFSQSGSYHERCCPTWAQHCLPNYFGYFTLGISTFVFLSVLVSLVWSGWGLVCSCCQKLPIISDQTRLHSPIEADWLVFLHPWIKPLNNKMLFSP